MQGIHTFTAEQYHADPAPTASLSSSIAKILLDQSPMHAWLAHPRLNTNYQKPDADSRFDLGSAAHMMLLEKRADRIVRVPHDDWRTNASKALRDQAAAEGKYAILERHYADVERMVVAACVFINGTELSGIFETGDAEKTVIWNGVRGTYRCRPDLLSEDRRVILDYKTTDNANPEVFSRQIGRMGYDLQSEFYTAGVQAVTGREDCVFVFLVQEITAPYACSLVSLSEAYKTVGRGKFTRATNIWNDCITQNRWPGYDNRIAYIEPTAWQIAEAELQSNTGDKE